MLAGGFGRELCFQRSSNWVGLDGCGLPLGWDAWGALISKVLEYGVGLDGWGLTLRWDKWRALMLKAFKWDWDGMGAASLWDGMGGEP